jgi:hypothetical protein
VARDRDVAGLPLASSCILCRAAGATHVPIQCPRRNSEATHKLVSAARFVPGARYVPGPAARDSTKEYALLCSSSVQNTDRIQ